MKPLVFQVKGFDNFVGVLGKMENVPQKCVTKAAGKGANVVRKAVRAEAPVDTGNLKRGIRRTGERSRKKGKKVYSIYVDVDAGQRVVYNPRYTKTYRKVDGKGTKEFYAYYPASMEYGFMTRSKGNGLSYVPGYHFMRKSAEATSRAAKTEMIKTLNEEIDKEWAKK